MSEGKQCGSCKGTGLYAGIFERPGQARVCWHCKGRGGSGGFKRIRGGEGGGSMGGEIHTVELGYKEWDELMRKAGL